MRKAGVVFFIGLAAFTVPTHSSAQTQKPTQISIQYKATLGGIYVGSAKMQIALTKQAYNIAASGSLSGVLKSLVGFRVDVKTYGTLANATMIPQRYSTEYGTANSLHSIKIDYSANRKAAVLAKPPFFPSRRRIALKPAHLKNTVDPLSALFLPVKKGLGTLSPDNCQRLMPVFDGRMRYNLKISSSAAQEPDQKIRGFDGPVLICRIKIEPIAGYSPPKPGTKKPPKNNTIEIWLTPMGSTGLLIPVKGRMPTPFGMAEISIRRLYLNGQKVAAL